MEAFFVMLAAGMSVLLMTFLKFPVSTSQCVIGAIIGWGIAGGAPDFSEAADFASAWIITPLGSMIICYILSYVVMKFMDGRMRSLSTYDGIIKWGYIISGTFGAYSLGANNVANATGIYLNTMDWFTPQMAVLIGGGSIALGVLTYSKRVMLTVGGGITELSPMTGFLSVLSCSIVVFIYAEIGIPVSSSQAIVGAVIGAGLIRGKAFVNFSVLKKIFLAWIGSPTISGLLAIVFFYLSRLIIA